MTTPLSPTVVHCKRAPYDIYIGRGRDPKTGEPGTWGNPFRLNQDGDRETVILKYKEWLLAHPALVERAKKELKGKTLGCWCSPLACHGDVLVEIANGV